MINANSSMQGDNTFANCGQLNSTLKMTIYFYVSWKLNLHVKNRTSQMLVFNCLWSLVQISTTKQNQLIGIKVSKYIEKEHGCMQHEKLLNCGWLFVHVSFGHTKDMHFTTRTTLDGTWDNRMTMPVQRICIPILEACTGILIVQGTNMNPADQRFVRVGKLCCGLQMQRCFQSLTSVTPSDDIWNLASASARQGELTTLQIRSSPLPLRRKSLRQNTTHLRQWVTEQK